MNNYICTHCKQPMFPKLIDTLFMVWEITPCGCTLLTITITDDYLWDQNAELLGGLQTGLLYVWDEANQSVSEEKI